MRAGTRAGRGRTRGARSLARHRSFDPRLVGELECAAWVAYYRREWLRFLAGVLALTRHAFGLGPLTTLRGAWHVMRANQLWAPLENDPDGARAAMERFYRLLAVAPGESFDPARAARLEVEWWRLHREHQRCGERVGEERLLASLRELYAYVYRVDERELDHAAEQRVLAMAHSDRWVAEGRHLDSPLIALERTALVRSYAALLAVVHVAAPAERAEAGARAGAGAFEDFGAAAEAAEAGV